MTLSKRLIALIYISLINLSAISCVIEIPLKPVEVEGVNKHKNLAKVPPRRPPKGKGNLRFYQTGYAEICQNLLFVAPIKIGSQSQTFNLLLDSGSFILWVAQPGANGKNQITHFFNPSSSSTARSSGQSYQMGYGSGYCEGTYYNDNLEYISGKKFSILFGVASHADYMVSGSDGIAGLAKVYENNQLSLIHMMKQSGNTDSLIFSVKFDSEYFQSGVSGSLFLGEHDDFKKSGVVTIPLITYENKIFWASTLSSFSLKNGNQESKSSYSTSVIFDTGTNSIVLPIKYLIDLQGDLSRYGCFVAQSGGSYQIACRPNGAIPDLAFNFNGHTFVIPKRYAFYLVSGYNYAFSTVQFANSEVYIMGSPFFFLFHTLFDAERNQMKFYPTKGIIQ